MKKLLTILCLVLLSSYSYSKETSLNNLVWRSGITYKVNIFGITSKTPFTGSSVMYHDNGQLSSRRNYKNGKLDGLWDSYYENGQLKLRKNYKNGEPEGLWENYWDTGSLDYREYYKNGLLDGLRVDGGDKTNYKNGKKHGLHEGFLYGGKCLVERGTYKNGKKDGLWERFYSGSSEENCHGLHSGPEGKTNYKNGDKVGLQVGYGGSKVGKYKYGEIDEVTCYYGKDRFSFYEDGKKFFYIKTDYERRNDSKSFSLQWDQTRDDFESILDTYLESILDGTYCED